MTLPLHPTLDIVGNGALFGFLAWLYIRARRRPRFDKSDVVYQERYASGCSRRISSPNSAVHGIVYDLSSHEVF